MNPPDEFRKHANDRVQIAKLSRGPESSAMWNRMAERWRQCAERYVEQTLAARDRSRTGTGDPRLVGSLLAGLLKKPPDKGVRI